MIKSSTIWEQVIEGVLANGLGANTRNVLDQLALEVAIQTVVLAIQNVVPFHSAVSGPVVQSLIDLGLPKLTSPSEIFLLGDTSLLACNVDSFVSLGVWHNDVAKLQDGWTTIKGKRSKSSVPPLDMNMWSYKGGSKSKSKS